jgi:hypothetical protein
LLSSGSCAGSSVDGASFAPDELDPEALELGALAEPCNEAVSECVAEQAMVPMAIDGITTRTIPVRTAHRSLFIVMRTLLELHHCKTCVALSRRMPVREQRGDGQAAAMEDSMAHHSQLRDEWQQRCCSIDTDLWVDALSGHSSASRPASRR